MRAKRAIGLVAVFTGSLAVTLVVTQSGLSSRSGALQRLSAASGGPVIPKHDLTPAVGQTIVANQKQVVAGLSWSVSSFTNSRGELCAGPKIPTGTGDAGQALGCWDLPTMFSSIPLYYENGAVSMGQGHGYVVWVWGIASPKVTRVALELTDCTTMPLPLNSRGIFFHAFSPGEITGNVGPHAVLGYGSTGKLIGRYPTRVIAVKLTALPACAG